MNFNNRVVLALHDEHRATIALMERLEQLLARHRRGPPPSNKDSIVARLLSDLVVGLEGEIQRHFAFEEDCLFTFLDSIGDETIGSHLSQEHAAIRPVGVQVATLARQMIGDGLDDIRWQEFCRASQELCERMLTHVQKEEMALLPVLEENMDAATEMALFQKYFETA